ncbi:hypothetical protein SynMITS9220_01932 [Synechococcus sp. MIT S9220]|nr:hypothetical protein SynMITS9220_01932 [Synechococcus sp. MIT S9220]
MKFRCEKVRNTCSAVLTRLVNDDQTVNGVAAFVLAEIVLVL